MKVKTRIFGEVEIAEEKVLAFDNGIIGLEDMKKFNIGYADEFDSVLRETLGEKLFTPDDMLRD